MKNARSTRAAVPTGRRLHVVAIALLLGGVLQVADARRASADEIGMRRLDSITPSFEIAAHEVADLDRDGKSELLVIGRGGEVRVWRFDPQKGKLETTPRGDLVLPAPGHTLFKRGDVLGRGSDQLVVLSPRGAFAYPLDADGGYSGTGVRLARRAKLDIRVGAPRGADILQDVNGDGHLDVLVPTAQTTDLWLQVPPTESATADGAKKNTISFRRAASVVVDVSRERVTAASAVSDRYVAEFSVPRLRISDINGDGRADLHVDKGKQHSFYLQSADGTLSGAPDVTVNLRIFKDTTPKGSVQLGETVAGSDDTNFYTQDLNGDEIPDYVIAHRRKVWVFHGTSEGPQFTRPSSILKVAEDISALLVVYLDEDRYPDLMLFKVRAPGIATLVRGLVSEWEITMTAIGYRGTGGRSFEKDPAYRSELVVKLPSVLSILRDPAAIIDRFENAASSFRANVEGNFDGTEGTDVALVSEDRSRVEVWFSNNTATSDEDETEAGRVLRRIFFEDEDRVWDLDRIIGLIAGFGNDRTASLTGERKPDAGSALRPVDTYTRTHLDQGDIDGDGRSELVLGYREIGTDRQLIDILTID